jgi:predicted metal-binding membrane protein
MTDGTLEAVLRRDRLMVASALGVIAALAWAYGSGSPPTSCLERLS